MSVTIGTIETFPDAEFSKAQIMKVVEESCEVHSAWERYELSPTQAASIHLVDEIADVFQALCNLVSAMGITDMRKPMERCRVRNMERGRY
jgi:NTP pyrophosphatase (non-canonical NTP hydrolase)